MVSESKTKVQGPKIFGSVKEQIYKLESEIV